MDGRIEVEDRAQKKGLIRGLYDACMEWLERPYGIYVLFAIAFAESSFFPIPPDVFLIALCAAVPKRSFKYAAICSIGSICGGAFGYGLGLWAMDGIGLPIIEWYGVQDKYDLVTRLYQKWDALIVFSAGFTPLPYKLFTIAAGASKVNFLTFMVASLLSRSARFFLVAVVIYYFGAPVKKYIDRYFNILSIAFMVLLIGGFVLVKYVL